MTVVMTAVIAGLTAANPEQGMAMAFTVVMLAGIHANYLWFFEAG